MGLRKLAGVCLGNDPGMYSPLSFSRSYVILGDQTPRRFRMARRPYQTVQFPSGPHGGRLHHIQRIL